VVVRGPIEVREVVVDDLAGDDEAVADPRPRDLRGAAVAERDGLQRRAEVVLQLASTPAVTGVRDLL
jgi:hypothetical protein